MPQTQEIQAEIQLLVEGSDDRHFFQAFARRLSLDNIQVRDFGGVGELRRFLSGFVASPGFGEVRSVGIVRDAEASAQSAFQSVQSSLRNAGLAVPDRPREPKGDSPSVNVMILPDDRSSGMLETLLCETLVEDPVNGCVDAFFDCVRGLDSVDMRRPDKSRAHAYLSTKPEPQFSVGVAAQRGYWDLEHSALDGVRGFLRTLQRDGGN